jgi:hypothetical protein
MLTNHYVYEIALSSIVVYACDQNICSDGTQISHRELHNGVILIRILN